jgi:hypothetical protein
MTIKCINKNGKEEELPLLEKKYFSVFMYIKVKTKFPALSW